MSTVELSSIGDGVLCITFRRPGSLNALNFPMVLDLHSVLAEAERETAARAIVLTGEGRAFCAGFDLNGYGDDDRIAAQGTTRGLLTRQSEIAATITRLRALKQPVIAAINGACAGAGLSYAAATDIRIAADGAVFCAAYLRAGFTGCDLGSSWLLPRIVGAGRAHELLLTARRFDAAEALRIGLVTDVVPVAELLGKALEIAGQISENPPLSTLLTKEGMWAAVEAPSLASAIELENRQQVLAAMTEDREEAALSFLEKRAPKYANR
ncbi:enoyl-CoA hydratase/isomerase family protein [Amycolatopsis sp. GM8]|uniref:enoyl-CoA hydratase/isomerase family protein n=1 Tax=Amycolatopsis sp. GM8 TaxID=2896530 RepID=UPI001F488099|nr:enoyl-CoA hydratase/isomerase family protein [Amycolatopsis sp. GM8]